MGYFKTNDPATVAAYRANREATKALNVAAMAFGERFGGKGYALHNAHGSRFGGVVFNPSRPTDIWTVATERDHQFQRPRAAARKGTSPERREELKQLREEWESNMPKDRVDLDPLYAALGTDWGQVVFSGMSMFLYAGTVYARTCARLGPHMVEILGSEYAQADEALKVERAGNAVEVPA